MLCLSGFELYARWVPLWQPRILSPKYGQTDNVKPQNANRGLPLSVRWLNFDFKVSSIHYFQSLS